MIEQILPSADVLAYVMVFAFIVGIGALLVWLATLGFVIWVWPQARLAWRTRVLLGIGVAIAATVAVLMHDSHVHAPGHFETQLEHCLERVECSAILYDMVDKE
jgi:hypothetical protein